MLITLFSLGLDILCRFPFSRLFVCPKKCDYEWWGNGAVRKWRGAAMTPILLSVADSWIQICPSGVQGKTISDWLSGGLLSIKENI
jgi:hypothetical protein